MSEEKNATISFSFYSKDYPDVYLSFGCSEDLNMEQLVDYFKRFAYAMSFAPGTVEKYLSEDY
jgi:hypothetical protein